MLRGRACYQRWLQRIAGQDLQIRDLALLDRAELRLEPEDALARELRSFQPHVVGTTSMTTDVYQALAALRMARQIVPSALTAGRPMM